jgi:hypothetical protein
LILIQSKPSATGCPPAAARLDQPASAGVICFVSLRMEDAYRVDRNIDLKGVAENYKRFSHSRSRIR